MYCVSVASFPQAAHVIFRQVLHALAPRRNWVVRLHLAQPAQNVVFFSFWQASSRDTPFSETAADSAGSVVSVFRHLHISLRFSPATTGFRHSVVSSVSTVASASTMAAGGGWYLALGRIGTTVTTNAGAMARRSPEPRCREGCWSRLHTRRRR